MARALVPLAEGFEEIEGVTIIDILRRGGVEVNSAYLPGEFATDLITGANGITVQADMPLANAVVDEYDIIVLPGGWGGTNRLAENELAQKLLKEFKARGKWVAAMCAAPYALHVAGVLSPKYTCYPSVEEQIRPEDWINEKVVVDEKVITSQGPGTAICFALEIVRQLVGEESYETVKNGTLASYC
ncbi:DJ-1 family glyoxalase III [Nitratifractor sp.]|uniref:DJ-1 family glyoxalase III n=1 Tax=Nitratifractor sp. TaxID=2268144 RepID=UPI0025EBD982|nr:DJ-1 family glyoxalase III [Nitratifractor sp.]